MGAARVLERGPMASARALRRAALAAYVAALSAPHEGLPAQGLTIDPVGVPLEGIATAGVPEFPAAGGGALQGSTLLLVHTERGAVLWWRESTGAPVTFQRGGIFADALLRASSVGIADGRPIVFDARRGAAIELSSAAAGGTVARRTEYAGASGASGMLECAGRVVAYVGGTRAKVLSFTRSGGVRAVREVHPDSTRSALEVWRDKRVLLCDEGDARLIMIGTMTGEVCVLAVEAGSAQCGRLGELREVLFDMVDARTSRMRAPPNGYHRLMAAHLVAPRVLLLQHEVVAPGAAGSRVPVLESRLVSLDDLTVTWRSNAVPRIVAMDRARAVVVRGGRVEGATWRWH